MLQTCFEYKILPRYFNKYYPFILERICFYYEELLYIKNDFSLYLFNTEVPIVNFAGFFFEKSYLCIIILC